MTGKAIPRIHVLTMVRNDDFFLEKWVGYYKAHFGAAALHVVLDGEDQKIPAFCEGTDVRVIAKLQGNVRQTDRARAALLSEMAAKLFSAGATHVIATDVDEFIAVDPDMGIALADFIGALAGHTCFSPLGVDVAQHPQKEGQFNATLPILQQRGYARLYARYTKSSILTHPSQWGSGFHRVRGKNFHICKGLYLFHLGCFDLERILEKTADSSLIKEGWSRHLKKRLGSIRHVVSHPIIPWNIAVRLARFMQTAFRFIFAWNKPTTLSIPIITVIPQRFRDII